MATLSGTASWFNHGAGEPGPGPADHGNVGQALPGSSFYRPGIAVYNHATLGGYWLVKDMKTGHSFFVQQTDVGPGPQTHRIVDFTWSAKQALLGGSDPTNRRFSLAYIGKRGDPNFVSNARKALGDLGVSTDQIPADAGYFNDLYAKGAQAVNFDMLAPAGVDPNKYQQSTSAAGAAVQGSIQGIGDLISFLTNGNNWLRLGELLLGGLLLLIGVHSLMGGDSIGVARKVAHR